MTEKEIYFAAGCFWGTERLFQCIEGVTDTECGYANGNREISPDYKRVCKGDTGYRETVRVRYNPKRVSLTQLLTAYFYVVDPTTEKKQGPDVGDQYQTGIYYTNDEDADVIHKFAEKEKLKYTRFVVEVVPLNIFVPAEEYHQDYLNKNPDGYCHIPLITFEEINDIVQAAGRTKEYRKPSMKELQNRLTDIQYQVTQNSATERAFTGKYWDYDEKGIYVDITTGQPLFSSVDKFSCSCGWPAFGAPIRKENVRFIEDHSFNMKRIEVRSQAGDAHLGHVFYGEASTPDGVRFCINSAALRFIPYEKMEKEGYGEWMYIFES